MRFKRRGAGAQVYEDVPLEMFADRLPAWPGPTGDTMSYSRDRSGNSRGVGAVASRDLREGGGGAVVRTARGTVTLVPSAERRSSRWGGPLAFGALGATTIKRIPVKPAKKIIKPANLVRSAFKDVSRTTNTGKARLVTTSLPVILTAGGPLTSIPVPSGMMSGATGGQAVSYAHPQVVSAAYGGQAAAGGGGGGIPASPSDGGLEHEVFVAEAPVEAPKPAMSTGVKVAAAAGIGWVLLSMFGKGL